MVPHVDLVMDDWEGQEEELVRVEYLTTNELFKSVRSPDL